MFVYTTTERWFLYVSIIFSISNVIVSMLPFHSILGYLFPLCYLPIAPLDTFSTMLPFYCVAFPKHIMVPFILYYLSIPFRVPFYYATFPMHFRIPFILCYLSIASFGTFYTMLPFHSILGYSFTMLLFQSILGYLFYYVRYLSIASYGTFLLCYLSIASYGTFLLCYLSITS